MYAIAIVRYRRPLEEVLQVLEAHRAYLRGLKDRGLLIASGPLMPRNGGALLLRVPDEDAQQALDRIRDDDPFTRTGMAQYEVWPWAPTIGVESPHEFGPSPHEFRPSPHEFRPSPHEFRPSPHESGPSPREFGPSPHEFRPPPHEFGPSPHEFRPPPQGFGPSPQATRCWP